MSEFPDIEHMGMEQLRDFRRVLTEEISLYASNSVPASLGADGADGNDKPCGEVGPYRCGADPHTAMRRIDTKLRLINDEIWRREDVLVDDKTLADYRATRLTWSGVDQIFPTAYSAWVREVGEKGSDLSILIWTRLSSEDKASDARKPLVPMGDCWLLAIDKPNGCRLRGPLDKSFHGEGCRCCLWNGNLESWRFLARDGLVVNLSVGDEIEGVLLGPGPDAVFTSFSPDGDKSLSIARTWLVKPQDRLPFSIVLNREDLQSILTDLIGQTIRVKRAPDVKSNYHPAFRVYDYAIRPVDVSRASKNNPSWQERCIPGRSVVFYETGRFSTRGSRRRDY